LAEITKNKEQKKKKKKEGKIWPFISCASCFFTFQFSGVFIVAFKESGLKVWTRESSLFSVKVRV